MQSLMSVIFSLLLLLISSDCLAYRVIVIRHGEAKHNVERVFNGDIEKSIHYPLTHKGETEVHSSAQKLRIEYGYDDSKIEAVYHSPLLRTRQTALILAKELGINQNKLILEPLITESNMGQIEGTSITKYTYGSSSMDHKRAHEYGGETDDEVLERMKVFMNHLSKKHHEKDILVVTHGTPAEQLEIILTDQKPLNHFGKAEFRIFDAKPIQESKELEAK